MLGDRKWFVARNGLISGPHTADEVDIAINENNADCMLTIWTRGQTAWLDPAGWRRNQVTVSHAGDACSVVGTEEAGERAALVGDVRLIYEDADFYARLKDVSETGIGVTGLPSVPIGAEYALWIASPSLKEEIYALAKLVYRDESGHAGLKFVNISSEARLIILDYTTAFSKIKSEVAKIGRGHRLERKAQ